MDRIILLLRRQRLACLALVSLGAWPRAAAAQNVKLNAPLAQPGTGDVTNYVLSPDGARVVFRADQDQDEVFELYSAPVNGGPAVRLNSDLPAGGDVLDFVCGANGRVVYRADRSSLGQDLFSVPIDGSAAPLLLSAPPFSGGVTLLRMQPGAERAVYVADRRRQAFSVPVDGSGPSVPLTPGFGPSAEIYQAWTTPASDQVLVLVDVYPDIQLHSVPIDAHAPPVELASYTSPSGFESYVDLGELVFTPDGTRAVYGVFEYEMDVRYRFAIFSVVLDGSHAPVLLLLATVTGYLPEFALAADGSRVVYEVDGALHSVRPNGSQDVQLATNVSDFAIASSSQRVVTRSAGALASLPIDGSQPAVDLSPPGMIVEDFGISPNSAAVVFVGRNAPPLASFRGLYVALMLGGSQPVLLNGPPLAGVGVAELGQQLGFTPDGTRVVYRADRETADQYELFSVPTDAHLAAVKLSGSLQRQGDVQSFLVSPDGLGVVYLADADDFSTFELFGVDTLGGTPPLRYNAPMTAGPVTGDVLGFQATADGSRAIYRADQDADELHELFSVRTDGRGAPLPLSGDLPPYADVLPDFVLSASGRRIVFEVDQSSAFSLQSARTSGHGDPIELDHDINSLPFPVAITPDETRVVYRKQLSSGNHPVLFSARLDGGGAPVALNPGAPAESAVTSFELDAPGERAVYLADQELDGRVDLYSVPVDGSLAPVRLDEPGPLAGDIRAFRVLAGGTVVYRGAQELALRDELYAVPLAGGRPPVRLNPPFEDNRDVTDFLPAQGGKRIVYRADQTVNEQYELFSVPIEGPHPPVRDLGGRVHTGVRRLVTLANGRDVQTDFQVHPDGEQVYFRAALLPGVVELFRVPVDGSAAPLRVSAPLVAGGNVDAFALSADGAWIVYRADQQNNEVHELFSVNVSGGPVHALGTLPSFGDVDSFQLGADSRWVVYRADASTDGVLELFRAPLDGSGPAERVNRPLVAGGNVQDDFTLLSEARVLFRADLEQDEVLELFLGFLDPEHTLPASTPTRTVLR